MAKRCLCLVLALALLGLGGGCTRAGGSAAPSSLETIRVGVSVYEQYDTFITLLMERFFSQAKLKETDASLSFNVIYESADGSQVTQNNQVESFLQAGCDFICINLVDRTDVSAIIDMVEAGQVPVLFFNRELVEEDLARGGNLYYIGGDAQMSGVLQGQIVAELCSTEMDTIDRNKDGALQYVMLEGEAGHQDAVVRTEYSVKTVSAAGFRLERLDGFIAGWSRTRAETKMAQWLAEYSYGWQQGGIEVVFANNDDMALGAIDALESSDLARGEWPLVVGVDGTRPGLQAVKAGTLAGTVLNNAEGQARAMVELICALHTGQPLPDDIPLTAERYIRIPYERIEAGNVQQYIDLYA